MYAFDDQGGVLPMQEVGVNLTGKIPSGKLGLNYVVEVGNGRAWGLNAEPVQNNQDANNSKSINGGLFIRPEKISGLQVGFSVRHDNLTIPGPAVAETIATVHAVYINSKYEILNEGMLVRHVEDFGPVFNYHRLLYPVFARVPCLSALLPIPVLQRSQQRSGLCLRQPERLCAPLRQRICGQSQRSFDRNSL